MHSFFSQSLEYLGYGRCRRKYLFIARRIFVEETGDINGDEGTIVVEYRIKTWYYSSNPKGPSVRTVACSFAQDGIWKGHLSRSKYNRDTFQTVDFNVEKEEESEPNLQPEEISTTGTATANGTYSPLSKTGIIVVCPFRLTTNGSGGVTIKEESCGIPHQIKISCTNRHHFEVGHGGPVPDVCQPVYKPFVRAQ
jgi:hypothetical protein